MAGNVLTIEAVVTNEEALRRLIRAAEILAELKEDLPWRPELDVAAKDLQYAAGHLGVLQRLE